MSSLGLWIFVGAVLGTLFGLAMDNIVLGAAFGLALGVAFGAAKKTRDKNKKLSEREDKSSRESL